MFGYTPRDSVIHRLTGASKLIMTLALSIAAMITYDTRFILLVIIVSCSLFTTSKLKVRDIKGPLILICVFLLINNIVIFLFAPDHGVSIYGTRHELYHLYGRYSFFAEQLFYQLNVTLKYFAIVPIAMIFFLTTEPGEFASSLNTIKVSYKAAYAVSLSLRYIPDIQRAYREISKAQQARGVDISKKAPLRRRLSGVLTILFPLVFSSMDKIDQISNALELRGFGRLPKRTWYSARKFGKGDYIICAASLLMILLSALTLVLNGGRFFNPFVG
ncbi:MAG: energy-coupling factor transporter transmembrane protein EcfT [Lachnospiraceae bacterium]|jgi:energy-coupling factor transport system permease protein|nr:energy-coupling factor transporter transmembrane protein EcfT [Lachnospiraceae bacterium]